MAKVPERSRNVPRRSLRSDLLNKKIDKKEEQNVLTPKNKILKIKFDAVGKRTRSSTKLGKELCFETDKLSEKMNDMSIERKETVKRTKLKANKNQKSVETSPNESANRRMTRSISRKTLSSNETSPDDITNKRVTRSISRKTLSSTETSPNENVGKKTRKSRKDLSNSSNQTTTPLIINRIKKTVRKKTKERDGEFFVSSSIESKNMYENTLEGSPNKVIKRIGKEINCKSPKKKARNENNEFDILLKQLHTSNIPNQLVCREEEIKKIKAFVKSAISPTSTSSAMYISGVPGAGKTASTIQVIKEAQKSKSKKFTFCYVNGMELPQPNRVFVEVHNNVIEHKKISPSNARRILNDHFQSSKKKIPVIILVDELDLLCTKKLDIIYDLFNWTTYPQARVSLITIANTLDLPERVLDKRITSRLGANRICFQPYEHTQIEEIICHRAEGLKCIKKNVIEFASRKIAAGSGDLRKALDIVRRATEIAVERKEKEVNMEHAVSALKEFSSCSDVKYFKSLTKHERNIIDGCISQQISSGLEEMTIYDAYQHYKRICLEYEMKFLPLENFGRLVNRMSEYKLLLLNKSNGSPLFKTFKLGMAITEAKFCLEQSK
uniref:Origin recognition complex subunit 1 n=1 Tax=Parastrongyloides trichosuri TaxID=131310 RepID=A0A0N4ZEY8_PARTI